MGISSKHKRFQKGFQNFYGTGSTKNNFKLSGSGEESIPVWFTGPQGENMDLFRNLISKAMDYNENFRKDYHPEDPTVITDAVKNKPTFIRGVKLLNAKTDVLLRQLQESVPLSSTRYIGHMVWDASLPSMVGYFAAMLYNQNNVAAEASPVTSAYELSVGDDLCRMLGFKVDSEKDQDKMSAWGHITCDGSMANLEGLWASRNVKFYAVALSNAIKNAKETDSLYKARGLTVKLLDGKETKLIDNDNWTLLNLKSDDVVDLINKIQKLKISLDDLTSGLVKYTVQSLGLLDFYQKFLDGISGPITICPITRHYSWFKNASILGFGASNMFSIPVDENARMDTSALYKKLEECLKKKIPVMTVVAVIGTTEESAVDDIDKIYTMREEFRSKGLDFNIHADAAWGGYFTSLLREDEETDLDTSKENMFKKVPGYPLNDHVTKQLNRIRDVDIITLDPHKSGYAPYPAGGLCYRNFGLRNLVSLNSPVIQHGEIDPSIGIYTVEGSKPGAAAAAVHLSHQVIRPTINGFGRILGESIFGSKRLYAQLVTMNSRSTKDERIVLTTFHRLPTEKLNKSKAEIDKQIDFISKNIVDKSDKDIIKNKEAIKLLREMGADLAITPYIFNFKDKGKLNTDVVKLNKLNHLIFNELSLMPGDKAHVLDLEFIITSSTFDEEGYGHEFMEKLCKRVGVKITKEPDGETINFCISTIMNPWLTYLDDVRNPGAESFLAEIEKTLRITANRALDWLHHHHWPEMEHIPLRI